MMQEQKNQIVNLSKRLMAIESVESNIREQEVCLDILEAIFKNDFHMKRYVFHGHPALVLSTTTKKKVDVIFSGHIDVVPGDKSLFEPRLKGTKLYGRGAYDMKAGVAACLYAATEYRKRGGDKEIIVMITSDEETSGYGTRALLEQEGYRGKFAFIADGGGNTEIVLKQKGFAQIKVTVSGKSAHASRPWEGNNPLLKIMYLQKIVSKIFPEPDAKKSWRTSVILTRIESANSLNQIPERAMGYFDIRYIHNKELRRIVALIKKTIGAKGFVEIIAENKLFSVKEDDHYVQTLSRILRERTKKNIKFIHENGSSDAVFFSENGIPASLSRPKGGGAHQSREWVDVDSLYEMYETLIEFLMRS